MNAIIYCRVSTKDQVEEGVSLETQAISCKKYAENNGYTVDRIFTERGESAKTTGRTQLQELLKYIRSKKNNIEVIIIYKLDRLSRNSLDTFDLLKTFGINGVSLKSTTENIDETPEGQFLLTIFSGMAQLDNAQKSRRIKDNMKHILYSGRWQWQCPIGYKFIKDANNKSVMTPDDDSRYVIEAFNLIATGLYKQSDVISILQNKGFLRANKTTLSKMLQNHLYAGEIVHNWFKGEIIKATHEALVTKEIFYKVKSIIKGHTPQITPKPRNNPDFPLRNFVKCPTCEKKITGSWSTGRSKKYAYYHCRTKGCTFSIPKEKLNLNFYNYLKQQQPKKELFKLLEEAVIAVWNEKNSDRLKYIARLEKEKKSLEEKQSKILELLINNTLDANTYKKKNEEIIQELNTKQVTLNENIIGVHELKDCLRYSRYLMINVGRIWLTADVDSKQRFQQLFFPEGITYDEIKTFRTLKISHLCNAFKGSKIENSKLVLH